MKMLSALLCVVALSACSGKPPETKATPDQAHVESAKGVTDPFSAMKADEQRAKDVQKVLDDSAARRDQQLESAESNNQPQPTTSDQ